MDTLVLGIGNEIKRDDVVGLEVVDALQSRLDRPGVTFETMNSGRLMLIDELSGHDRVCIIDSIVTEDGDPGDWYVFDPQAVEPDKESGGLATHNVGLGTLTTLGEAMGESMPEITIYAIEVADPFEYGEGMTEAVSEAVPRLIEEIGDEIEQQVATAAATGG
ncbi:hydrogenase maturation protease [Halapricum hydrolyticum]|uniref:Hydrogenase maturation protease n=1 Tax=Halapricum hydrolyticum TaxID=2979991 RepID=A0AAE3IA51_9EURY|nr:hydrogenase maturation protease [Halapricum hydrolyticum]MCU4717502.1 hydrogenase maturation protease [Halapricum hydrolyticum]MCU4726666.1 hydrogenase maturation protease [Halapricum hydrolyticum]